MRHPRLCNFFQRFGKCKFEEKCSYLHISLFEKSGKAENEMAGLRREIEIIRSQNSALESIILRIDNMESELKVLKQSFHPVPSYSCELCSQEYETIDGLKHHKQSDHEAENPVQEEIFKCDFCDYVSTSRKGVNIHTGAKHKDMKSKSKSIASPRSTTSRTKPPVPCTGHFDGCTNIITNYFNKYMAICHPCEDMLKRKLESSPYPPNLCPSCHKPNNESAYSLCSECCQELSSDGSIETSWGIWHLDRDNGDVVCIQLDF